jgi:hypothetical protein
MLLVAFIMSFIGINVLCLLVPKHNVLFEFLPQTKASSGSLQAPIHSPVRVSWQVLVPPENARKFILHTHKVLCRILHVTKTQQHQ